MLTLLTSVLLLLSSACQSAGESADTNSASAVQVKQTTPLTTTAPDPKLPRAYFAGGCFWCTEASFERIEGVQAVVSGYSGGTKADADYKKVSAGVTDHAEAIAISYDPAVVSYRTLLEVFFVAHDPTTLNRQGPDRGRQYRSAIFFSNPTEEQQALAIIDSLNQAKVFSDPIVTDVTAFDAFYDAEEYHQGYYELHPENPYVTNVSRPKVKKVEKRFYDILKPVYKK